MSGSPFSKKTSPDLTGVQTQPVAQNSMVPVSRSGLIRVDPPLRVTTAISKADVDQLGSDLQVQIGRTSNKIISTVSAAQFGDIGQMLSRVQNVSEKLDPNKQFGGIGGWFRSKFVDVKAYLRAEFQSAEKVFDALVADLTKHIAKHDAWVQQLDVIFEENNQNYKMVVELIAKGENWKTALQQQIAGLPPVVPSDPDAMMKAQDRADIEALVTRLDQKIDTLRRIKMLTENNAPKIRGQQRTSDATKTVLRDIIDFTIPVIRQEFVLFLHSLDSQKSQDLIKNVRTFGQQTMIKSADSASTAAISAAHSLNAPAIDNVTLEHLRDKILFTISEVKKIEGAATQQRLADASSMQQSTDKFITQLTS